MESETRGLRVQVRERRRAAGLSQQQLAERAGISRQALVAIEAGRLVPSVAVALRLARALGCRVDDLFALDESPVAQAAELVLERPPLSPPFRVRLARVGERLLAWPVSALGPEGEAEGIARAWRGPRHVEVELLADPAELERTLVLAGCDPALAVLGARLRQVQRDLRVVWVPYSSLAALRALARGEVHVAGTHLWDPETGECNLPFIARELAGRPVVVVTLSRWVEGLLLAPDNPKAIRSLADLVQPTVRIVNREPGSGARLVLDEHLRRAGIEGQALAGYDRELRGHATVAEAVANGLADAGPGPLPVARRYGLDFLPLLEERYDLVIPVELYETPAIQRLLEVASSASFRRELEAGGYDTRLTGCIQREGVEGTTGA